ncbi:MULTISPECIES: sulfite exporter TauE/SafE family protein [unclassified Moraxella]|uniref:sulfite exporter TauE/SafE family protein n=1 Tax=unclassified Moraxella TaxID=2685852 RepID=UPI003AF53FDA
MSWALLLASFGMGFFGSPHCLGMCGGIVTAFGLSMQGVSEGKKNALILTYHLGRLLSYATLGLVAGFIGTTVLQPFMVGNRLPAILLGSVLMLIGLSMLGFKALNSLEKLGMSLWQKMSPIRQKVFPINSFPKALMAGLLWGFLPCGLVYGALLMAVVGHDVATGAVLMFVFGLGTLPMLIATQKTIGVIQQRITKFRLRQVNGILMILSGLAVIFVPMLMMSMHGGHGGHSGHGSMNMSQMNHDMSSMHSTHNMASMPASSPMPTNHQNMNHAQMNHDMSKMTHQPMASTPAQ